MITTIRGYLVYEFDYNFQQDVYKFRFDELNEFSSLPCFLSTFPLIENRQKDKENGIYFEKVNNTIYLRAFDISEDKIENDDDDHPFYTWKEIWKEYENYMTDPEDTKYYMLKDEDKDIVSIAVLTDFEYKNFIDLMKKYSKISVDIEIENGGFTLYIKDLIVKLINKDQYDILDNSYGIELYDQYMRVFEKLEGMKSH